MIRRNLRPTKPETPGQTPSLKDKCTGLFYVHYTTHGTYSFTSHPKGRRTKQLRLSVLLKDTSAAAGNRTHILVF